MSEQDGQDFALDSDLCTFLTSLNLMQMIIQPHIFGCCFFNVLETCLTFFHQPARTNQLNFGMSTSAARCPFDLAKSQQLKNHDLPVSASALLSSTHLLLSFFQRREPERTLKQKKKHHIFQTDVFFLFFEPSSFFYKDPSSFTRGMCRPPSLRAAARGAFGQLPQLHAWNNLWIQL